MNEEYFYIYWVIDTDALFPGMYKGKGGLTAFCGGKGD